MVWIEWFHIFWCLFIISKCESSPVFCWKVVVVLFWLQMVCCLSCTLQCRLRKLLLPFCRHCLGCRSGEGRWCICWTGWRNLLYPVSYFLHFIYSESAYKLFLFAWNCLLYSMFQSIFFFFRCVGKFSFISFKNRHQARLYHMLFPDRSTQPRFSCPAYIWCKFCDCVDCWIFVSDSKLCIPYYAIVYAEWIYGIIYYCFEYFANVGQEADRSVAVCVYAILSFLS